MKGKPMLRPPSDRFMVHEEMPAIIWFRRAHGSPFTVNEALGGYKNSDVSQFDILDMIAHACWAWDDDEQRVLYKWRPGKNDKWYEKNIKIVRNEISFWKSKRKAKT
jgi:hypothetical protein